MVLYVLVNLSNGLIEHKSLLESLQFAFFTLIEVFILLVKATFVRTEFLDSAQWRNLNISKWSVRLIQLRIHVVSGQNARDVLMRAGALYGSWTTSSAESQLIRRSRSSIWVRDADLQPVPFRETRPDQGPTTLAELWPNIERTGGDKQWINWGQQESLYRILEGEVNCMYANNFW